MTGWTGWIADNHDRHPQIGKIKGESWRDDYGHCANVILYSHTGDRIGRRSPDMGGPTTYEPACDMDRWKRIKKPDFPLRRLGLSGEWLSQLVFLEESTDD